MINKNEVRMRSQKNLGSQMRSQKNLGSQMPAVKYSLEELLEQKAKLEKFIIKYSDSSELKEELENIELQIQKLNPDVIENYFSEKLNENFIWNKTKNHFTFESGVSYTEQEMLNMKTFDVIHKIHTLKKTLPGLELSHNKFQSPPKEVSYVVL